MTKAEKLAAICARVGPGATYVIHTTEGQGRKVVIDNPATGDRVGAAGATLDAALAALDAKVPGAPDQEAK